MMIGKIKSKYLKLLVLSLLVLVVFKTKTEAQTVSLSFSTGFLGTQGNNSNSTTANKTFTELGISKVSFSQVDANGDGKFGDGGTQGNDLAGTVKLYLASGQVITLTGALNFRNNGNTRDIFGFIFDPGQNASFTYGTNQTYSIVSGTTPSTSTSLGLRSYSSTYTITSTFGGNASTNGLLDALNLELANSPQPSTIALTNASVTEGQNLVYTVTLTSATTANNPQVYTFSSAGTASSSVDYNSTYTFSNSVVNNGDGTITVPGGVSSFTITVATTDDASVESTETLILNIGSKSATGSILDNDAVPAITTSGTLKTFTTCSGCAVSAQSFTVSGTYLTNNLVVTAPSGFQVSTTSNSGFATSITLTPATGTVSTTTVYAKLTDNSIAVSSGVISVTSTGATSKTITVTTNTDNALSFDGTNDYVDIPDNNALDLLASFTIEAWVNPTVNTGSQVIIGKIQDVNTGLSADLAYALRYNNGVLTAQVGNGVTAQAINSNNLVVNKWQHVAMVFNGSNSGSFSLYIDGVLQGSTLSTGYSTLKNVSTSLKFGNYGAFFNQFYKGLLDKVKIWNIVKTQSEISAGMFSELIGDETGLVAYYDFDQGVANSSNAGLTSLINKTATASINGTLTNFGLTGTSSNYVAGSIPNVAAAGNATTLLVGNTLQLSNGLTGGSWTSSNTNFATVSSTGLVTGVAAGSVSISYTICSKTVSYNLTVIAPTVTVTSALKNFSVCSSFGVAPQSVTVSGSNLSNNIVVTAPIGYEISTTSSSGYTSTVTLTQTSGTVSSTSVFIRVLTSNTTAGTSTLTITSTGVTTQNITLTANADNALGLDGSSDYVSLPTNVINGLTNFTFESWVYPTSSSSWQRIFDFGKSSTTGYIFLTNSFNNNRLPRFAITTGTNSGEQTLSSSTEMPLNTWSHIAIVLNASAQSATMYLNGSQVATGSITLNPSSLGTITTANLGKSFWADPYLAGKIDEVRIWNTVRTASEIANNYQNELSGNEAGLLAYYNINQGVSNGTNTGLTSLIDKTNNNYNGTLNTFALSGSTSNYVSGSIQQITAAGNATTLLAGNTLQLSNSTSGGSWSSSNNSLATVSSTGLVTGVAAGTVSISYTICSKTVSYNLTLTAPSLTVSILKTFTSCSGCVITPQILTVSGSSLSANVVLTAPTGFEISSSISGNYSSTLSLAPSAGTLNSTAVYVRLINSAITASSGSITVSSTGAASKTVTTTVNTDNALNLDGVDDYVVLDNVGNNTNLSFGGTANFTLEAWVNRKATGSTASIISKFDGGVVGNYRLYIHSNGIPYFSREASPWSVAGVSALPENEWHHIAGVFDGSAMKLYIDGVLVNSVAATGSVVSNVSIVKVFLGAANQSSISNFFKGGLDEIRVWNVARTATQIQNSYLTELAGNETGLAAYYNFNQGVANGINTSITTLTDRGSNNITGTLTNIARTEGVTSNFVVGLIPVITGTVTTNVGSTSTLSNTLTGGTWSSSNASIASVNSSTGVVTAVAAGSATITYTICEKTVSTLFTVTEPTITATGTLSSFTTCATTNSNAQTFTVSAQYLTANLVLTAPTGYEIATSAGGTYSSTISIAPSSGVVSARLIYVRTTTSTVNGQSGNIVITSTGATTKNVATGNAVVTQNQTASVSITSNATNNTICSGASITFTATATSGGLTPTYQWKLNGTNINGATNSTYTTSSLSSNATITVVMVSDVASCISGSPATSNAINVVVNNVPNNPGVISGLSTICMNSNQVYSIPAVTGATSYTWVVTGSISATTTSTSNVINITADNAAGSGTLLVNANNACGTSVGSSTLSITVNNTPAPTASFTVSATNVCVSSGAATFSSTSTPNATTNSVINSYAWDFGNGVTASTASVSNTYTNSGTFNAILTIQDANACVSSFSRSIVVDPLSVAGTATAASTTICEGSNTTLNLTGSTGSIQWQNSTDGITYSNINGANSATYTTPNLIVTTYYKTVVTNGACSSASSGVVTVTVSPTPSASLTNVTGLFNSSTSFDLVYSSSVGSPNEYSITSVAPNALPNFVAVSNYGLLGSPISVNIPASASGLYNFNLVLRNNTLGCTSSAIPFTISIAIQPPLSLSYTTPNVYIVGSQISPLNPISTGGTIATYSIGPSLPAGLTLNTSTGIITGIPSAISSQTSYVITGSNASGTVSATVVITVNAPAPVITVGGTLSAFSTCSGVASSTQTVTVSGVNLTNNISLTAPTGYELSTDASNYSTTVTLTQSSGTISTTNIYVRLTSAAINGASGTISVISTGANSQTFATGTAVVNVIPTITLNATTNVSTLATSFNLSYASITGSPNQYSISTGANALAGFTAVVNATLSSTVSVTIPASSANTYDFNITVKNSTTGCVSAPVAFTQTVIKQSSTIVVTGATTYIYNGSAQGPATNTKTGSTGAVTYSYAGTGSTTYGPSATPPTAVGTYEVIATLAADANYNGATSAAYAFTINDAPSVISINRVENTPTNLSTLHFLVTFSKDITGFDVGDLTLVNTGTVSTTSMVVSTITSSTYTVTVSGITGNGTLGLDLKSSGTGITDSYGAGITNGITGQVYTIDKITLTPSFNTPATNDNFVGTSLAISINIPEVNLANSIRLTFTGLSNTVIVTLNNGNGTISGNLNLNNLLASSIVTSSSQSTLPSDIYTVTLSYQDYLGNPVASTSITNFKVNYNLPSTIVVTGATTYTYSGSAQGPATNTKTGSTGAVTYSYVGTGSATYGPSATPPTNAGTYEVVATLAADASYSGATSAPYAFTITAASSTIVVTGATTYTYSGSAQGPATNTKTGSTGAVTYSYVGTGSTTYGPSATPPTSVGTYQVIATLAADANYTGATSAPYAFTITAASSTVVVTGATNYTYSGSAQGPATNTKTGSTGAVTYSYVGTGSTTYGPSATPPTGVGSYQVIATLAADANYNGATSAPYAFTITAASSTIVVTGATTYTYSGSAQGPATNTKTGSTGAVTYSYVGTGSTTYGPSATPPTSVGTYQVIATLAADANYTGATSAPYAFTITAASSTIVVTGATTYTYNASAQGPATNTKTGSSGAVTYSYAGTGSTTYGPSATPPTGVGSYQVIATLAADANYNGATSAPYAFTITAASSTIVVTGATTYTYSGSAQGPATNTKTGSSGAVTYSYAGTGSTTYGPSATPPTGVGTYQVIATLAADANYSGATSAPYAFTITAASSTIVVTGATTYTYNASAQGPATNTKTGSSGAVTYSYAGTGSTTYGPSATPPTGVGSYQVIATLAADANYNGATSAPYAFTITAASSTVVITGATNYSYSGSAQGPATNTKTGSTGAVTYSYVGTGSTTYGPSATPPTGVGTYEVIATLAADANYNGATSAPYAFTITAASSTIVVTGATTYTYSGSAQGPATNTKTGSTGAVTYSYVGTGSTTYGPSATPPTSVGTYQVIATLAADANYTGATSAPYAFTITAASSTIVVTGATTYTYNASAQGPATNTKTGSTGAVTYSYVGTGSTTYGPSATPPTNAGTYEVVATLAADVSYSGATSAPYAFTINKLAPVISLGDIVKTMGDANFTMSATSTSAGAITYSIANANIATVSSNTITLKGVGVTTITVTQAETENYLAATTTATLTVKPAAPSVTPGSYIIGNPSNPSNTSGLITPINGATLNFYSAATGGTASSVQPLPTIVGVYTFYVSQTINGIEGPRVPYTVTILPTVSVKSATYIIGANNNPANISSLVSNITTGSKPKWCNVSGTSCTDVAPTLPTTAGVYIWCVKAVDIATGLESSGCIYDTVTILAPATVMGVQKKASALTLQPDGSYTMDFTFTLTNYLSATLDSIQLIDNLSAVFISPSTFKVLGVTATGTLVASNTFNGTSVTNLLLPTSKLGANKSETVVLRLQVMPQSYAGTLTNNATGLAASPYGTFGSPASTTFVVPAVDLFIADVLTPNQDGKNDQWIIVKPSNKQLKVEIINRWGQRVYANSDYQNNFVGRGTGSFLGQDLAEGTYFYFIEIVDKVTGVKEFRKGYLTLKR